MKLSINAELTGQELVDLFIKQLNENKIEPHLEKIKFVITKKDGSPVEMDADKIKLIYSNN